MPPKREKTKIKNTAFYKPLFVKLQTKNYKKLNVKGV